MRVTIRYIYFIVFLHGVFMKSIFSIAFSALLVLSPVVFAVESVPPVKAVVASAKTIAPQEAININTADAQALTKLKGIGAKKADAIIAWRKANGGFKTIEQFTDVKGIGAATLEANRKNIRLQ